MNDIINNCSQSVLKDEQGAACFAIAERVVNALIKHGLHISFAESCTGGLAAARIVDVPNASYVLDASFVTYAERAKVKFVNVAEESIAEHGVVSECVALSMAKGAAAAANAEIGVGISGIAGPSGGSPEKPVGTVCFGFYFGGKAECGIPKFEISKTMLRCSGKAGCPQCKREFCFLKRLAELLRRGLTFADISQKLLTFAVKFAILCVN